MSGGRVAETGFAIVAVLAASAAALVAVRPDLVDPRLAGVLFEIDQMVDPALAIVLATLALAGFALWRVLFPGSADVVGAADREDEEAVVDRGSVVGEERTATIDGLVDDIRGGDRSAHDAVVAELRTIFVSLASELGRSEDWIETAIETGAWSDDRLATIVLSEQSAGEYTFLERLRGWLFPGWTVERRIDRTIDALGEFVKAESGSNVDRRIPDRDGARTGGVLGGSVQWDVGQAWTPRWHAAVLASLAFATGGIFMGSQALILAGTIPLGYVGWAALSRGTDPTSSLRIARETSTRNPLPGEPVDVSLRIENVGSSPLTDVRIAEQVPEGLRIVDGTDRAGIALRAGEERTIEYRLRPKRGTHRFGDVLVRVRNLSAAAVATAEIAPEGTQRLRCRVPVENVPIHRRTVGRVGTVPTDSGGAGLEFHSTREYRHGDPPRWIDWRRLARTNELGTIRYRRQEATTVVVVIDGRAAAQVVDVPGGADGVTLSVYAGVLIAGTLIDANHQVGLVGLGVRGDDRDVYRGPPVYVPPRDSGVHAARIAGVCDTIAAREGGHGDGGSADELDRLLPPGAQLLVVSPFLDAAMTEMTIELRRRGYDITALSPDLTGEEHVGARVLCYERAARMAGLRRFGVPVVSWDPTERLHLTLERMRRSGILVT